MKGRFAFPGVAAAMCLMVAFGAGADEALSTALSSARPKIVKIHGSGGGRQLEGYQSGILVAGSEHVLTVASHVLAGGEVSVTLDDGTKAPAKLLAQDLSRDLALLEVEGVAAAGFDLHSPREAPRVGTPIVALSNLFDIAAGNEPVSAQTGFVSGIEAVSARQGSFAIVFRGDVLLLDCVTNNPGAAGGAVVDLEGRLLGMIGKEVTAETTGVFLNYAIPVSELAAGYLAMIEGRRNEPADSEASPVRQPHRLEDLGLRLVPDVLLSTPPFVEAVAGAAEAAGLRADDLVIEVQGVAARDCRAVREQIRNVDRIDPIKIRVLREGQIVDVELRAPESKP